jgi:hypothetical protein
MLAIFLHRNLDYVDTGEDIKSVPPSNNGVNMRLKNDHSSSLRDGNGSNSDRVEQLPTRQQRDYR